MISVRPKIGHYLDNTYWKHIYNDELLFEIVDVGPVHLRLKVHEPEKAGYLEECLTDTAMNCIANQEWIKYDKQEETTS